MKKLFRFTLLLALLFALTVPASALVAQSGSFYVCDDAGVLSSAVEEHIIDMNGALEEHCSGAQIVVVSVAYMDGLYSDEYAYALMNDWGVGSAEEDNGMLLLFATKENRAWLAVGNGIFGTFDEDVAGMYLDNYFWDGYDAQDYDGAVTKLFDALCSWYESYYQVSSPSAAAPGTQITYGYEPEPVGTLWDSGQSVFFNLLVLAVVFLILFSPLILFSLIRTRVRWGHWGVWPIYYFRPWWRVRVPRQRSRPFYSSHTNRSSMNGGYSGRSWGGSSSRSSWSSGSSHSSGGWSGGSSHSSGGFSSHSSGSGHGGGGHSGGGAGRR